MGGGPTAWIRSDGREASKFQGKERQSSSTSAGNVLSP